MIVAALYDPVSPFGSNFFRSLFRPGPVLYSALCVLALIAAFLLLFILVSLWERQYLAGAVEPATEPYPAPPPPYWLATRADAIKLELRPAGDFVTKKKAPFVKGLLSLFISPDHTVIASIFASTGLKKTVLRTKLATGRIVESTDNGGIEDMSGVVDRALLLNAGIAELMEFHKQRLQKSGSTALAFNPNAVLAGLEQMELEKGARWVLMGLARWADPQHTSIRMTFRGALANVRFLFRQMAKLKGQQHRTHIRRAGAN
jgi:hypothetical protein